MNAIKDILHDEKYKGVTGLVDVLNQYIEEQFTKAEEEDTKISAEEKDVVDERTVRKTKAKIIIIVHSFDNCWYWGRNWTHIHALVNWVIGVSMGHVMQNAEVAPWPEPEISSKNPSMEEQLVRVWDP